MRRLNFAEHLSCLCLYKNRINVGRAQAQFMVSLWAFCQINDNSRSKSFQNLSSDDPVTTRPQFLHFRARGAGVIYPQLVKRRNTAFDIALANALITLACGEAVEVRKRRREVYFFQSGCGGGGQLQNVSKVLG
jgi:hypothetical protein